MLVVVAFALRANLAFVRFHTRAIPRASSVTSAGSCEPLSCASSVTAVLIRASAAAWRTSSPRTRLSAAANFSEAATVASVAVAPSGVYAGPASLSP